MSYAVLKRNIIITRSSSSDWSSGKFRQRWTFRPPRIGRIPPPEKLNISGNYFGSVSFDPVFVIPGASLDTPLNVNLPSFGKILPANFTEPSPGYYAVPFGTLLFFT
jgi:hypothetical protein